MLRMNVKVAVAVLCVTAGVGAAVSRLSAQQENAGRIERKGVLAGLPGAPGGHVEKIKAMADDSWLSLGVPAADPKWGRAMGRSWSSRMAYAPDVRGAFITGEANHGWVNPKT